MNTQGTLLMDLHSTFLRMATMLAQEVSVLTGHATGAVYFDAHEDDSTFPDGDHVGLSGMTFDVDQGMIDGSVMIGMTTQTDVNLFRLIKGMNIILSAVMPGGRIHVVGASQGQPKGFVNFVDGTRLMPVSGKASRPIQFIAVKFVTTTDYRPE